MMNYFKTLIMNMLCNLMGMFRDDRKEETGSSELITVIALIVIVLAVVLIFKDQLINIITQIGNKVSSWVSNG